MKDHPQSDKPHPLQLRHCPGCDCDVNHFEWKHCQNVQCNPGFEALEISYEPRENILVPLPKPILDVSMRRRALLANGMNCPFCWQQAMTVSAIEDQTGIRATRQMTCPSKHTWYEVFSLSTILTEEEHDTIYMAETPIETSSNDTSIAPIPT
jgi:hypothetical protein